jgi:hypothetical protein
MGFFDLFKKKQAAVATAAQEERLENYPEMLHAKLLFADKPKLDRDKILAELKLHFSKVENPASDNALMYFFPDIEVKLADATIAAQCAIFKPDENNAKAEIAAEAFQQNWHWQEAAEAANKCRFEVLVSDFMTRTLDYNTRLNLFGHFLAAVTKATGPDVVYCITSQKLVKPEDIVASQQDRYLENLANVRLFNISNGAEGEVFMDTVGLHLLGLPDFQIKFSNYEEGKIAGLLWNYAYYIFEKGDIIESGNTMAGLTPDSKWTCVRQISQLSPERVVINIEPN